MKMINFITLPTKFIKIANQQLNGNDKSKVQYSFFTICGLVVSQSACGLCETLSALVSQFTSMLMFYDKWTVYSVVVVL